MLHSEKCGPTNRLRWGRSTSLRMAEDGRLARLAILEKFPELNILVVGDVMLDRYLEGHCERISPEAPVPVVRLQRTFSSLGGAANVAVNLSSLNVHTELIGCIGDDLSGRDLRLGCQEHGIGVDGLCVSDSHCTTVKTRILATGRQLLRIDEEVTHPISDAMADVLLEKMRTLSETRRPDAVILSDYAKGLCTRYFCQGLMDLFAADRVPVYVDPKGMDYEKYRGATGIKPNRAEMVELAQAMNGSMDDPVQAAERLRAELNLEFVALTLGMEGIAVVSTEGVHKMPTLAREVFDVTGAGDTVIATMVAALASGLGAEDSFGLSMIAAGEVVSHVGSRPILRDELLVAIQQHVRGERNRKHYDLESLKAVVDMWKSQGLTVGFTNGCFDLIHAGHVTLLGDSAARVDKLIVAINSDDSVRRLKGPLRPLMSEAQRIVVLSGLESVDAVVIFEEDTPLEVLQAILPDVLIKGGDYTRDTVVGAGLIEGNGGRVELVPLVPGVSTSHLASAIEKL